jgi:hypothetical protein
MTGFPYALAAVFRPGHERATKTCLRRQRSTYAVRDVADTPL